jgi:hypothetical protein
VLFRLVREPAGAPRAAGRAMLVLLTASAADGVLIALLRITGLVVFPGYQVRHAALMGPADMLHLLPANIHALLALAVRMVPPGGVHGLLVLAAVAGFLTLALGRIRRRAWPLAVATSLVLLAGFAGPMLVLRDPVVQPRVLLGVGAMISASCWTTMRLLPSGRGGRVAASVAVLLVVCFMRDAFAYGALLRDLDRSEAEMLPAVARAVNAVHAETGLGALQIQGVMPYPPALRHGLDRAPGLAPLFDNPLNGISWFGVALLAQYGLEDGIWFRDPGSRDAACRITRDSGPGSAVGPGFAVGHDSTSLILLFRNACS